MFKNKNIVTILFCFLFVLLTSSTVYAADKEYNVDGAEFVVNLEEDGDAIITEKWQVTFINGEFSRFYKDIYKDVTSLEKFSDLDILDVKVNDTSCEKSDSLDRVDYHYFYEENNETNTIHWFLNTKNSSNSYEITYRLKDVVKETDENKALFCYRFIGANFPKTVDKTTVTIYPPNETEIDVRYSDSDKADIYNDRIVFQKDNVSGVLKYNISVDASNFSNLNYVSLETIKSEEKGAVATNRIGIAIFLIVLAIIVFSVIAMIIGFIKLSIDYIAYKKIINNNPSYFKNLANNLENKNIHPLAVAHLSKKHISAVNILKIILLDLCRREKCYVDKDELFIDTDFYGLCDFEIKLISSMADTFKHEETSNSYIFSLSDMSLLLDNKFEKENFIKLVENIWSDFEKEMKSKREVFNSIKKDIKFLKFYFSKLPAVSTYEYFTLVERTHYIDYLTILGIIYLKPTKLDAKKNHDYLFEFCDVLDDIDFEESSSSSNGYSCSSCSSCGGCGGGGAD